MNANDHYSNRNAYPLEKLVPHAGKYVAWAMDGKEILASANDIAVLVEEIDARYPVGTEFIISYIPAVGEDVSRPLGIGLAPAREPDGIAS